MDEYYMKIALKLANKAYKNGDVPVGAVIVLNNKIIAKGFNKKEKNKNSIDHAEIIAIKKACKKLNTWHLDNCKIYITMEPCIMCYGAILQSRIKNIIYSTDNIKYGAFKNLTVSNKIKIKNNILKNESIILLQQFFKNKRN